MFFHFAWSFVLHLRSHFVLVFEACSGFAIPCAIVPVSIFAFCCVVLFVLWGNYRHFSSRCRANTAFPVQPCRTARCCRNTCCWFACVATLVLFLTWGISCHFFPVAEHTGLAELNKKALFVAAHSRGIGFALLLLAFFSCKGEILANFSCTRHTETHPSNLPACCFAMTLSLRHALQFFFLFSAGALINFPRVAEMVDTGCRLFST